MKSWRQTNSLANIDHRASSHRLIHKEATQISSYKKEGETVSSGKTQEKRILYQGLKLCPLDQIETIERQLVTSERSNYSVCAATQRKCFQIQHQLWVLSFLYAANGEHEFSST